MEQIEREKSISKAAEKLGVSYRYVWSYLQRIKKTVGEPAVETRHKSYKIMIVNMFNWR